MMPVELSCSFCSKTSHQVTKLIEGQHAHICDTCVNLCHEIINEKPKADKSSLPTPKAIKEFLDEYVVGQDSAKETLAVAVYNHYKRLENPIIDDVEIDKSNILMLGPTGCGKTLLAQSIARMLDVPFAIADATSLTEAGYVGDDVESIITRLLQSAENDVSKAERGIIYIDEIDKKKSKGDGGSGTRDVSGEGVQQALLKIIEGCEVFVPPSGSKKRQDGQNVKVNTKNILFIVGGAFVGLDKIISAELSKGHTSIGFSAPVGKKEYTLSELTEKLEPKHLVRFGLIPEMIGRLPVLAALDELTEEQLISVMTVTKNSVTKQFVKLFKIDNVELEFDHDALKAVAKLAIERKTGARGLRSVIETALKKTQFNLPDLSKEGVTKIYVQESVITNRDEPIMIRNIEESAVG